MKKAISSLLIVSGTLLLAAYTLPVKNTNVKAEATPAAPSMLAGPRVVKNVTIGSAQTAAKGIKAKQNIIDVEVHYNSVANAQVTVALREHATNDVYFYYVGAGHNWDHYGIPEGTYDISFHATGGSGDFTFYACQFSTTGSSGFIPAVGIGSGCYILSIY